MINLQNPCKGDVEGNFLILSDGNSINVNIWLKQGAIASINDSHQQGQGREQGHGREQGQFQGQKGHRGGYRGQREGYRGSYPNQGGSQNQGGYQGGFDHHKKYK